MIYLGDRRIVLHTAHVQLVPKPIYAWLGLQPVEVPYAAIADTVLVSPLTTSRGQWTIQLHDGTELAVGFPKRATHRMESIDQEILLGALAAQPARKTAPAAIRPATSLPDRSILRG